MAVRMGLMWIRKSVPKQRKEFWLDAVVFAAACVGVGAMAMICLDSPGFKARMFDSILAVVVFVAAFALIHLRRDRVVICETCQHPQVDHGRGRCACGRKLVDVREMQWVSPGSAKAAPSRWEQTEKAKLENNAGHPATSQV